MNFYVPKCFIPSLDVKCFFQNKISIYVCFKVAVAMFNYMTTDFSTVEMLDEQEIEAEGIYTTTSL